MSRTGQDVLLLLSDPELEALAAGETLFWEGEACAGIFLIGQGRSRSLIKPPPVAVR
jgi:hypothetical protein